jgi:hypothetical protein
VIVRLLSILFKLKLTITGGCFKLGAGLLMILH